jgi:Na+-driven multidrug efflux pump
MPTDRQKLFLEGPLGTALFRLSVPIILGNVLQTGYQLTDAFWVGRLGPAAVAAVSISFPVTFLVIALGSGLAIAGAVLSAQYMGAGLQAMVNHVAAQTMLMVAVTSAVLGSAGFLLAPFLLDRMGVAPEVYQGALSFMRVDLGRSEHRGGERGTRRERGGARRLLGFCDSDGGGDRSLRFGSQFGRLFRPGCS